MTLTSSSLVTTAVEQPVFYCTTTLTPKLVDQQRRMLFWQPPPPPIGPVILSAPTPLGVQLAPAARRQRQRGDVSSFTVSGNFSDQQRRFIEPDSLAQLSTIGAGHQKVKKSNQHKIVQESGGKSRKAISSAKKTGSNCAAVSKSPHNHNFPGKNHKKHAGGGGRKKSKMAAIVIDPNNSSSPISSIGPVASTSKNSPSRSSSPNNNNNNANLSIWQLFGFGELNRLVQTEDTLNPPPNKSVVKKQRRSSSKFFDALFCCCFRLKKRSSCRRVPAQNSTDFSGHCPPKAGCEKLLLPPARPCDLNKKCLIVDLDETLVHSSFKPVKNPDFIIPVEIDGVVHQVYVLKRPNVEAFLEKIGSMFECVLFTASLAKYADPVADLLDKNKIFRARLFREACVFYKGNYVKDLNLLGRDLKRLVIVDNSPASYAFHPENAVPVQSWFEDVNDKELLNVLPILEKLSSVDNIYSVLSAQPFSTVTQSENMAIISSSPTKITVMNSININIINNNNNTNVLMSQNDMKLTVNDDNDPKSLGGAAVAENLTQQAKTVQTSSIDLDNIIMSVERTAISSQTRIDR